EARLRSRGEPAERGEGRVAILFPPERVVGSHRFAPVGEGERRIDALRFTERLGGVVVLEGVQEQHAADEGRLRRRRSGIRKADRAELRRRGRRAGGGQDERERQEGDSRGQAHCRLLPGSAPVWAVAGRSPAVRLEERGAENVVLRR